MSIQTKKVAVATLSVVSNTVLVILKVAVGLCIGSVSVISEAIHSGVDLLAAAIALFAVRTSVKPADACHQYGHGKVENISGTIEALLIFMAAGWIVYEAVKKLMHPEPLDAPALGVAVMAFSSAANLIVSRMLFKVGKEADSVALQADGWHLRTDVYTSLGVMAGLALIALGNKVWPAYDLRWIDPVAAIFVAALILRAACGLTVQATRDLLDRSLPDDERQWIEQYLASLAPDVRAFHALRTRKSGPYRFVEMHVLVDPQMTVEKAHAITDVIGNAIRQRFTTARVTVHVEPSHTPREDAADARDED